MVRVVTVPANPTALAVTEAGFNGPIGLRAIDDDRLLGLFAFTGIHVFDTA
jgi:hypothetical protein